MSATFDTWLEYFYNDNWNLAHANIGNMVSDLDWAYSYWNSGNDHDAIQLLIITCEHYEAIILSLLDVYQYPYPRYNIFKLFELIDDRLDDLESVPPVTVDMDAIVNAMLATNYTQLQNFIGIVDAYRVALWDNWFNSEFYAALARGFKQLSPEG